MEMIIDFPGGARVDAHFGPYTVNTDQPPAGGGQGSAPTPFAVFLSSLGACAGIYVLGFCKQRCQPMVSALCSGQWVILSGVAWSAPYNWKSRYPRNSPKNTIMHWCVQPSNVPSRSILNIPQRLKFSQPPLKWPSFRYVSS